VAGGAEVEAEVVAADGAEGEAVAAVEAEVAERLTTTTFQPGTGR